MQKIFLYFRANAKHISYGVANLAKAFVLLLIYVLFETILVISIIYL